MVQSNKGIEAMHRYQRNKQLIKARRLAEGRPKHRDEELMDIAQIEAYIEHTLEIVSEDIADRTKAAGPALKLLELKHKVKAVEGEDISLSTLSDQED